MNEQNLEPKELDREEKPELRHIEPDWTESEWLQVWLELARRPHSRNNVKAPAENRELSLDGCV